MSRYIHLKRNLAYNEMLIVCPHCKAELIKEIEFRATGENQIIYTREKCPICFKEL